MRSAARKGFEVNSRIGSGTPFRNALASATSMTIGSREVSVSGRCVLNTGKKTGRPEGIEQRRTTRPP
ncbi:hypothetical protein QA942_10390 [Streptomyces sp. B21-106]|uniref:hypothetical protein n=1 Tax=Streptomyces sp. B21-106 TaxID=3039418 RepID=UPI002FEF33FA